MESAKEGAIKLYNLRYLPLFAAYLILGIFCIKLSYWVAAIVGVVAVLFSLALLFSKSVKWGVALALMLTFCLGFGLSALELHLRNDVGLSGNAQVTCRAIEVEQQGEYYVVTADELKSGGTYYGGKITFITQEKIAVGDDLTIRGEVSIQKLSLESTYSALEYRKGAKYEITPSEVAAKEGTPPVDYTIKEKVRSVLVREQGERAGAFSYAMLFGDTEYMESTDKSAMREVGVAHVFAVSGLHVGVLAAALLFLLRKLRLKDKYNVFIILPLFGFYAYLVGFSPSVLRASFMATLALASSALGERYDDLSAISLAAVLILLVRPLWLFDVSFIMSFLAVLGIASLASPIEKALLRKRVNKKLASGLAFSLSVTVALLPVMTVVFGKISIAGVLLNLVVIPLAAVAYILNLAALLLTLMIPSFGAVLHAVGYIPLFLVELSKKTADLRLTLHYDFSAAEILAYYAVLLFVGKYSLAKKKVKLIVGGMGGGVLLLLLLL